jgi:hypothetical protein
MPNASEAVGPAGAVLVDTEADVSRTTKPDLEAAGADPSLVRVLDPAHHGRPFSVPEDLDVIRQAVKEVRARLVVLAPLSEILNANMNNDQGVRRALRPLVRLAEEQGLVVLLVRHFNRAGEGIGSVAIKALARSVLTVERGYDSFVLRTQTNLAATPPAVAYRIVGHQGDKKGIEWLDAPPILERPPSHRSLEIEKAKEFVVAELLAGPLPAKELESRAKEPGIAIAPRTLRRAKQELGVVSRPSGPDGSWQCSLPDPPGAAGVNDGVLVAAVELWLKSECKILASNCSPVVFRDRDDERTLFIWGGSRPLRLGYDPGAGEWILQELNRAGRDANGKIQVACESRYAAASKGDFDRLADALQSCGIRGAQGPDAAEGTSCVPWWLARLIGLPQGAK